jgi:hypothetical protein
MLGRGRELVFDGDLEQVLVGSEEEEGVCWDSTSSREVAEKGERKGMARKERYGEEGKREGKGFSNCASYYLLERIKERRRRKGQERGKTHSIQSDRSKVRGSDAMRMSGSGRMAE